MTPSEHDAQQIAAYFESVISLEKAYQDAAFTYVAIKSDGKFDLIRGVVAFNTGPILPIAHFETENVRAGRYSLSELKISARQLLDSILAGKLETPVGELHFPPRNGGQYSIFHTPIHDVGIQDQQRLNVLHVSGDQRRQYGSQAAIDWELKAATVPYEGLQELMFDYGLGQLRGDLSVEFVAFHVAAIDFGSKVSGNKAWPTVILANGLDTEQVTLGYRIFQENRVVKRMSISGTQLEWSEKDGFRRGTIEIEVAQPALLHCVASYKGVAQHFGWLSDPATVHNVRRAIYEAFDRNLETLKEIIAKAQRKGDDARDLEAAVGWLLWMLGFSAAHLGGTKRTQDAADLIVAAPNGNLVVVECTTGLLKADNKLSLLHDRAQAVHRAVEASGNRHLHVLTALVTSKMRDEVAADLEQAEKLGVLVLTRENLDEWMNRTMLPANADQLYAQAKQTVEAARAKYENQSTFPFAPLTD